MSYSIKNTRVRTQDIKAGRIFYTAHPVYGIEIWIATGKPYMHGGIGLFVKCKMVFDNDISKYEGVHSLVDMGISKGDSYNGRRTFRKLSHAKQWIEKWKLNPQFQINQKIHENYCKDLMDCFEDMDY